MPLLKKIMGDVQRLFYFHMGYVLVFTLAFCVNLYYSVRFLITNNINYSTKAYLHAEIGVLFTFLTIVSGMFWAKPVWGTWWTWGSSVDNHIHIVGSLWQLSGFSFVFN